MRSHMCSLRSEIWKQKDDCQNKKMWTIIMCPVLNDWNVCQNIEFWRGHLWKCRYIKVCKVIQMKLYLGCVAHVPKQKPLRIIFQATFRNVHRSVDRTLFSFVLFGSFRNKKRCTQMNSVRNGLLIAAIFSSTLQHFSWIRVRIRNVCCPN